MLRWKNQNPQKSVLNQPWWIVGEWDKNSSNDEWKQILHFCRWTLAFSTSYGNAVMDFTSLSTWEDKGQVFIGTFEKLRVSATTAMAISEQ